MRESTESEKLLDESGVTSTNNNKEDSSDLKINGHVAAGKLTDSVTPGKSDTVSEDDVIQPSTSGSASEGVALLKSDPTKEGEKLTSISCSKHSRNEQVHFFESIHPSRDNEVHEAEDHFKKNSVKVSVMITITFLFFFVELTFGIINRSIALLADSYHMLSDVMALVIALACLRIARRDSDRNGFGWVRAEVLGAMANAVFLLTMCFTIVVEALGRFIHPKAMSHPMQVLIVGFLGLLINLVGIGMFHGVGHGHSHGGDSGHGHSHGGGGHGHSHDNGKKKKDGVKKSGEDVLCDDSDLPPPRIRNRAASQMSIDISHNHLALRLVGMDETLDAMAPLPPGTPAQHQEAENLNMRGVLLHVCADAIGSLFVICTAATSYWFSSQLGSFNLYLDPCLSLILVCLISYSAYSLVRQTSSILIRTTPAFLDIEALKKDIQSVSGVSRILDFHAWTLVANRHIATVYIEFCSLQAYDQASSKIRRIFHRNNVHSITIQPEFSTTCIIEENPSEEEAAERENAEECCQ